jgi:hypothetical protein
MPKSHSRTIAGVGRRAAVVALALLATPAIAGAQPPAGGSEVPETAALEAQRRVRAEALETFLDRSETTAERLAAIERMGYPTERAFTSLLRIVADPEEADEVRLAAFQRHRMDEELAAAGLAILADPADGGETLDAGLVFDLARRTRFPLHTDIRQEIQEVLRGLLRDPRESVRVNAFRALAPTNDAVAIELLGDSVREGTDGPVPLAEAIDLLDLAGSTGHLSLLRPLLDHPDLEVQMQAVKALGVDPASHDAIIAILEDRGRPTALRVQALRGLKRSDPGFVARAVRLIDDRSEAVGVREAALH